MMHGIVDNRGRIVASYDGNAVGGEPIPPELLALPLEDLLYTGGAFIHSPAAADPVAALAARQSAAVAALGRACEAAILGGFWSDALGSTCFYESSRDDQLNLTGAVAAGIGVEWPCAAVGEGKVNRAHTAAQLKAAIRAGAAKKKALIDAYRSARSAVATAETEPAAQAALDSGLSTLELIRTGDAPNA